MGNNPDVVTNATNVSGMRAQQARPASGKPVVGFLYSISKTAAGEFWPIHIGQNTIGQNILGEESETRKNEQMDLFEYRKDEIIQELQAIDVMALTPMDAMNKLFLLKEKARKV